MAGLSGDVAANDPGNMGPNVPADTVAGVAEDPLEQFAELVDASATRVPLDEACLLIAATALPKLDRAKEIGRIDDLATGCSTVSADGVVAHLVGALGFTGDRETYHDARNSLLPAVIDRRRGIPLSLSILALEVGRRVGVELEGIGMPGHFLLREAGQAERFHDVFTDGRVLDRAGCRVVFEGLHGRAPWDDGYLDAVDARSMLTRMVANLAGAHRRAGDRPGLVWALRLRLTLPGATDRDRRELAVLLNAHGRFAEAATVLEATGVERDTAAAARMRARLN